MYLPFNEIGIFRTIAEWYLVFFSKFRSHRVKNEKVLTKTLSQLNAPVIIDGATLTREISSSQY